MMPIREDSPGGAVFLFAVFLMIALDPPLL